MTWWAYHVVLRLCSPLHIGFSKVGNLQRTRPYVTGRVLWGALTMRLTRDVAQGGGPVTDSLKYREFGHQVHQSLAFTYFYPALTKGKDYQIVWPWENASAFRRRFISSYQGTALSYPQQSAAEGTLHEVEFIAPYTLDTAEAVFLTGYVFERDGCTLQWQLALDRLQLGGERGYGWGNIELVQVSLASGNQLFGGAVTFNGDGERPVLHVQAQKHVLAHVAAGSNLPIAGEIEPLVGREWRSDNQHQRYAGQHVAFSGLCFTPGSMTHQELHFEVQEFGVWQARDGKNGTL